MSDTLIQVEGLYKKFSQNLKRSMFYGTADTLRSMVGIRNKQDQLRKSEFWALQDINFELKRGEVLGLIGRNGCGKSTLLRLLTGIFPPDKGKITINGRVGALIAVGAGFHPHMSGRENVYLNGTILGLTRQEIKKRFEEIVEFAEIGEFIDAPVATYSSGMRVRLGFAIAAHIEPDILFIDEVLAVGDVGFQLKCFNKIGELRKKNTAVILVSHNMINISSFTNNAIVLENGKNVFSGETNKAIEVYENFNKEKIEEEYEVVNKGNEFFTVTDINFTPKLENGKIAINRSLELIITYTSTKAYENVEIDVAMRTPAVPFKNLFRENNKSTGIDDGKHAFKLKIDNIFIISEYVYLSFAIWANHRKENLFWIRNITLETPSKNDSMGIADFNMKIE